MKLKTPLTRMCVAHASEEGLQRLALPHKDCVCLNISDASLSMYSGCVISEASLGMYSGYTISEASLGMYSECTISEASLGMYSGCASCMAENSQVWSLLPEARWIAVLSCDHWSTSSVPLCVPIHSSLLYGSNPAQPTPRGSSSEEPIYM